MQSAVIAAPRRVELREGAPPTPGPGQVLVRLQGCGPEGGRPAPRGARTLGHLPREELAAWLGRASIFALPARYEPFGLGPLEAALAGCALVLGDVPSLREVWGPAACFVPPGEAAPLAAALRRLIDDPAGRGRLAQAARARALRYGPERMTRATLGLHERLLGVRALARGA